MQRWFVLCESFHNGSLSPKDALESETSKLPRVEDDSHKFLPSLSPERYWWDWIQVHMLGVEDPKLYNPPNVYENDTDVAILASMAKLLEPDLRAFRSNVTGASGASARPLYAEIGIPFYFYNNYRPPSAEPYEDTWELAGADARWAGVLKSKFSVAAYRAGFHRQMEAVSDTSPGLESSKSWGRVLPSPYTVIVGAEPSYSSCALLGHSASCNQTKLPIVTILNVDFSRSSLSLFAELRGGGVELPWIPWNTWPELGGDSLSKTMDTPPFWKALSVKVKDMLLAVDKGWERGNVVKVVLSGDALSSVRTVKSLKSSLQELLGPDIWMDQQSDPSIAASVGAGTFAHQWRLQFCEGTGLINRDEL